MERLQSSKAPEPYIENTKLMLCDMIVDALNFYGPHDENVRKQTLAFLDPVMAIRLLYVSHYTQEGVEKNLSRTIYRRIHNALDQKAYKAEKYRAWLLTTIKSELEFLFSMLQTREQTDGNLLPEGAPHYPPMQIETGEKEPEVNTEAHANTARSGLVTAYMLPMTNKDKGEEVNEDKAGAVAQAIFSGLKISNDAGKDSNLDKSAIQAPLSNKSFA
ncbi:hypothetical protein LTR66_016768 [Elasticomyces elasticus]|nr:hypothetical protein LTR66_016768 [Elasticomyces elasticus]